MRTERAAGPAWYQIVHPLARQFWRLDGEPTALEELRLQGHLALKMADPSTACFVTIEGDEPVGYAVATMTGQARAGKPVGRIEDFFAVDFMQGTTEVAWALHNAAVSWLKAQGAGHVDARVSTENRQVYRILSHLRYKPVSIEMSREIGEQADGRERRGEGRSKDRPGRKKQRRRGNRNPRRPGSAVRGGPALSEPPSAG